MVRNPFQPAPEKGKNKGKADPAKAKGGRAAPAQAAKNSGPASAKGGGGGTGPKSAAGSKPSAPKGGSPKGTEGRGSAPARSSKPAARGGSGRARPQQPLPPAGMALDRKLDLAGILLIFVGLITGLSLFASQSDIPPLRAWLDLNRQLAGWGVFGLPVAFMGVGLWLVLRKFGDRLPKLEPERLVGLVLLYLALLATFHFMVAETVATVFTG